MDVNATQTNVHTGRTSKIRNWHHMYFSDIQVIQLLVIATYAIIRGMEDFSSCYESYDILETIVERKSMLEMIVKDNPTD